MKGKGDHEWVAELRFMSRDLPSLSEATTVPKSGSATSSLWTRTVMHWDEQRFQTQDNECCLADCCSNI